MIALIVSNGSIIDYNNYKRYIDKADFIIGADGGAGHLKRFGIKPDLLVGDFDSVNKEDIDYFQRLGVEIRSFPAEKDMTDTELAASYAAEKGCKTIIFLGCLGTRFDHSLANIFLLKRLLDQGITGIIVNEYNEITVIKDKIHLTREGHLKVTLLPLSEKVYGVTTKGLYYPLDHAIIEMGSSWGVSNEFAADEAEVTITEGLMLVVKSRD